MAVDEEVLYTVLGKEVTRSSIVTEMINYYLLKLEVGDTRITDFNEGSEIRNLLEAYAVDGFSIRENQNELTKIGFIHLAEGEYLDLHGANPRIDLTRDTGTEASGMVTFSITEPATTDIIIPEETLLVCEENDLDYVTNAECIIGVGDTSVTIGATCLTVGEDGNCSAETINVINDDYLNIPLLSVTNESEFTNGTDYEEDDDYRERLLAFERKDDFGSIGYYQDLGDNVPGVHDILLVDDLSEENPKTKIIYVNGNTKPVDDAVLIDVLEVFSNPENIVVKHTFSVEKPDYVPVNLDIDITVENEIDENDILAVLNALFDGGEPIDSVEYDGLSIGETLTKNTLYSAIDLFDDVNEVTIYHKGDIFSDLTPEATEVFKLGTVDINQTIG